MADIPVARIKEMKGKGMSNNQVIDSLQREGFSSSQIFDALSGDEASPAPRMPPPGAQGPSPLSYPSYPPPQYPPPMQQQAPQGFSPFDAPPPRMQPPQQMRPMMGPMGSPMGQGMQAAMQPGADTEELIEAIIDEKWNDLMSDINKVIAWKEATDSRLVRMEQQLADVKDQFEKLHQAVIGKVGEYDQHILDVGAEVKAMEKVFSKVLPVFTDKVAELSRVTDRLTDVGGKK